MLYLRVCAALYICIVYYDTSDACREDFEKGEYDAIHSISPTSLICMLLCTYKYGTARPAHQSIPVFFSGSTNVI